MDLENIVQSTVEMATSRDSGCASLVNAHQKIVKEINVEAGNLNLLRTNFDQGLSIKNFKEGRQSSTFGNQFDASSRENLVKDSLEALKSSPVDAANGFSEHAEKLSKQKNAAPCDEPWMLHQIKELMSEVKNRYPRIKLENVIFKHLQKQDAMASSYGAGLQAKAAYYECVVGFCAKDGTKSSSTNDIAFAFPAQEGGGSLPLIRRQGVEELFRQTSLQTEARKIQEKGKGSVIVTPHCMEYLVHYWSQPISSASMLKKTSFLYGKMGERVASPLLSWKSEPLSERFAKSMPWTSDGVITQNEEVIKSGVLKSYLLNQYASKSLQLPVSRSFGYNPSIEAGATELAQMIAKTKRGILLSRLAAGNPAENGEFSGVAKNSFFIENGEIAFPINETMISGNIQEMLNNISAVSCETINSGSWEFPWVQIEDLSFS